MGQTGVPGQGEPPPFALKLRKRMRAAEDRLRASATGAAMAPAEQFVLQVSDLTEDKLAQTVWLNTVGTFGQGSAG